MLQGFSFFPSSHLLPLWVVCYSWLQGQGSPHLILATPSGTVDLLGNPCGEVQGQEVPASQQAARPRQGAAQAQLAALLLEMSGYRAVAVDSAPKAGLSCLHCGHFLREPVQTEEGLRVCKACFAEIKRYVQVLVGHYARR